MGELDSIDSTLAAGTISKKKGSSKGEGNSKKNYPDITGISSGKKDRDEEAMMKDFGDVGMSEDDSSADASSGDDESLESLSSELGSSDSGSGSPDGDEGDEEEHHSLTDSLNEG